MKFEDTYKGQSVVVTNEPHKIGYIVNLSIAEYIMECCAGTDTYAIGEVYVNVDHGKYDQEYNINELSSAKGFY